MTALWILAGIFAFLALVLSFSAVVTVVIGEDIRLYWGAFGFRKRFGPGVEAREKPEKKKRAKKKKEQKPAVEKKAKELEEEKVSEKSLSDTVEFVLLLVRSFLPGTMNLLSHLRFTSVRIWMTVAGDEADLVAIRCGAVAAGVYNLLAVVDKACCLHVKSVDVVPDFVTGEASYDISFQVKLRFARILYCGIGILFKLLVNTIREKQGKPAGVGSERL